jgi:hypothetical protein
MKFYGYRNNYFGIAAIHGTGERLHFRFAGLSWLTKEGLVLDGPGIQLCIFGWLVKFGWFTKIERF